MQNNQDKHYQRMTETPVSKLVIALGIPTTISMLVTNIYNMADTYFVGRLGKSASGAIGIVFGYMAILQAFGFMYGQGAGSLISRKLGQKDTQSASNYASISFFMSLATGVILSLIGLIFMEPLLKILGSTDTILPYAKKYIIYIIISAPLMMSSFVLNNILRFEGKASLAMIGLVVGSIINIGANPIFMFVLDMGIAGAGLATALSQCISFTILLCMFLCGKTECKISIKNFKFDLSLIWNIISTGLPSLVRQGLNSISTMVLNLCASHYGDAAVAAMSIVGRINFFMFAVGLGIGQGYQPVCAFNYGAKKFNRVRKAFTFTFSIAEIMLIIIAIIGLCISGTIVGWFIDDIDVIEIGKIALRFQCIALFFQPLLVTSNMTFQSTGQRALATFTATLRNGLYFIPLIVVLSNTIGILGIQSAQAIADVLAFITVLPFTIKFIRKLPEDI